ncbi:MAG: hypothetical protein AABO58_03400 [Acidobacteriota bacterium]
MKPETRRHYASTLIAMLNYARAERVIPSHQLEGVRVPQVLGEDEPEPWTSRELAVILGPALDRTDGTSINVPHSAPLTTSAVQGRDRVS